jgi:hypothetical protein
MADTARAYLAAGSSSAAAVAPTARLRLIGFSAVETAGATAKLSIQEGAGASLPQEMAGINLASGGSVQEWFGDHGLPCPGGIFVNRIEGASRVVIFYRISDRDKDSFDPPAW